MKIVIIGGAGLIGSKVVSMLRERGHDAVPADLNTGVNALTGEGLAQAVTVTFQAWQQQQAAMPQPTPQPVAPR